ncbi:MAG: antitoxin component HigA of HigAB toxin-antitoxin module [Myxococcota bacterium]|jgi:antitoxin component HigA of HigAB toxin-antitoxin module
MSDQLQASPITRIDNDEDLQHALSRLYALWGAEPGTPDGDERDALADLIEPYETAVMRAELTTDAAGAEQ